MNILRLMRNAKRLNGRYGDFFGYKLIIITTIVSIIFTILALSVFGIIKYAESKEEFILDSERKFMIYRIIPESSLYYEIDFNKGEATCRKDSNGLDREKIKEIKAGLDELESIIIEVIGEQDNLKISDEDKNKLIMKNSYEIYAVRDYKGQEYYIKNAEQIKQCKEILK